MRRAFPTPRGRDERRCALVTGGNRGIGFELCRQLDEAGLRVILAGRDADLARQAALELGVEHVLLDVADPASVRGCAERLREAEIEVDVLVNNAGVYPSGGVLELDERTLTLALEVNLYGPLRTCQAFVPGMLRRGYGRVVNLSSGSGSFAEGISGPAAYGASKAGLNALTVQLARELTGDVKVNAMCPGWVRTRMGGTGAPRSPAQGADTALWLAPLDADGPNGGFFRDRAPIEW